jgi:hypothetical protein
MMLSPAEELDLVVVRLLQEPSALLKIAEGPQHRPATVVLDLDHELYW